MKPMVNDAAFPRRAAQGDLMGLAEIVATLATVGAGALTGALLASNILSRTGPAGAVADTVDTASNIINAVGNGATGDTWRLRYINNVAFAITVTGVTGVTVTNGVVNASSVKDFLLTLTCATPQAVVVGNTTNASAVVTGLTAAQTATLGVGQLVSGTSISGGTTILSIQPGVGFTMSANATATGVNVALTANPTVSILGLGQGLL
jgi:hypothetical protein